MFPDKKIDVPLIKFEIPEEVQYAWVLEHAGVTVGLGSKLFNEYLEIKKKYPEYFKS